MPITAIHSQRFTASNPSLAPEPPPLERSWPVPRLRRAAEGQGAGDHSSADVILGQRLGAAMESGYTIVEVPANSSLAPALAIYRQQWRQPAVQAWLTSKGLETASLTLHKDFIEGFVTRDGVRTRVRFTTSDDSGWWQASAPLRVIRDLLDPQDRGINYLADAEHWIPVHVVLTSYGTDPSTPELEQQLRTRGLSMPPEQRSSMLAALARVQQTLAELADRPRLADQLELLVQDLPDATPWQGTQPLEGGATARQMIEQKGLGTPQTVGEVRNVIQWLRTTLPPAPPLGNYSGFMGWEWAPGQLSAPDKATLTAAANAHLGGTSTEGLDYLDGHGMEDLQADPAGHLQRLLDSPDALTWGERLGRSVNWYGTTDIFTPLPKAARQQMVIAAIKLHADPQTPGKPGQVAGYELYQPANMGRTFGAIRRDLEKHLHEVKGLDPKLAVLAAHIGLAQAAPEFLVRDVPDAVHVGTPAWMELRLGCAMVDAIAPGTSRAMNEEQLTAFTLLGPASEGQAVLMQMLGVRIVIEWAVLNGVIRAMTDGPCTEAMIKTASSAFLKQRQEVGQVFSESAAGLPSRRSVATDELLKVFPGTTASQLEEMTVTIADAQARRNMRLSEPRTRSLVETYMTGDLTPGKWVLSSDLPPPPAPSARTPYTPSLEAAATAEKCEELDARIRRLPGIDDVLVTAVTEHRKTLQRAYATKLKLMIAELPLEDRRLLELGNVQLFTLRKETGSAQRNETEATRDALKGRQGTLIRAEYGDAVAYYEVFAKGGIVKRTDLPREPTLGPNVRTEKYPTSQGILLEPFTRGYGLTVDIDAYVKGSDPRPTTRSTGVIIEQLGNTFAGSPLPAGLTTSTYVPDSYSSQKTADMAAQIAEGNFYEPLASMLARAKGVLPLEQRREAVARDHGILLGLVPFVGAYQEFKAGNMGSGLFNLGLDIGGMVLGAAGRARSLIRGARTLAQAPLPGALGRLGSTVSPLFPKKAWAKPIACFSDGAFNFVKQGVLFTSAAFNPVDGYLQLANAATKGLAKVRVMVSGGALKLGRAAPHLITVEEKMRSYLLTAAGQTSAPESPVLGRPASSQGIAVQVTHSDGHWYAIDPLSGQPFGTPLVDLELTA